MSATLDGKTALVTGAGRGIGEAACRVLAEQGARVVVAARRAEDAARVASAIRQAGGAAQPVACDVADDRSAEGAVAEARRAFGPIDILVSNAGVIDPIGLIRDADPAAWARSIEINLVGPLRMLKAALPDMVARGEGVVVHLSSGAARTPLEGWSAYCAGKAGLAMLTRSVALEYGPAGVRAYGFSPGVVDTGMQAAIRASGINPVSKLPRESLAPADEPAKAIAFLCGPGGRAFAGQEIDIRDPAFRAACGLS